MQVYVFCDWTFVMLLSSENIIHILRKRLFSQTLRPLLTLNIPAYLPPYSYRGWTNLSTNCIGTMSALAKKCKANIPSTSNLEHILFLHRPWKNSLSTLEAPLNFSNFYYRRIMHKLAFLRFLAPKILKSKNKWNLSFQFFQLNPSSRSCLYKI